MNWKAIPHSVEGTSHQKNGLPCQDYVSHRFIDDDILIGAVSDGAGSAKHSDTGSKLAVETTLDYLQYRIEKLKDKYPNYSRNPSTQEAAKTFFKNTLEQVISCFNDTTEREGYLFKDLSCTLLAFIATPHWMTAMQVGDGFIVVRSPDSDYRLVFPPAKGEYANQTVFVTSSTALSELQVDVIPNPPAFIFASTDGLERLAITLKTNTPFSDFFKSFEDFIQQNSYDEASQSIKDFLNSDKVNAKTDDDKTILLCFYDGLIDENKESLVKDQTVGALQPIHSAENKTEIRKIPLALLIQNCIFAIILGLLCHYSYNYSYNFFDLLFDFSFLNKEFDSEKLINYTRWLWLIIIALSVIFNGLTYFIFNKYLKNRLYPIPIILLSVVIGFGIGWMLYYPNRFNFIFYLTSNG